MVQNLLAFKYFDHQRAPYHQADCKTVMIKMTTNQGRCNIFCPFHESNTGKRNELV
jgi:hypothetical protein